MIEFTIREHVSTNTRRTQKYHQTTKLCILIFIPHPGTAVHPVPAVPATCYRVCCHSVTHVFHIYVCVRVQNERVALLFKNHSLQVK